MPTLTQIAESASATPIPTGAIELLHRLLEDWQVIADLAALLQLKVVAHRRQLPCTLRIHEAFIYLLLARLSFVALWKPVKSFGQLQRTGLAPIR